MKSSRKWLPVRKHLNEIDAETERQKQQAEELKELSHTNEGIINEVTNRIQFFSARNHFSDKMGRFLSST